MSLIDDDEDENVFQPNFSINMKKTNKGEDNHIINNKKLLISGNTVINLDTAKKQKDLKNLEINTQQKIVTDFRNGVNKQKLILFNIKNKILSQNYNNNSLNNNINGGHNNDISIPTKEEKNIQNNSNRFNKEENKENKLSKNLLNERKERKKSLQGKIFFYIAISMLLYQYLCYVLLIEVPIIESK